MTTDCKHDVFFVADSKIGLESSNLRYRLAFLYRVAGSCGRALALSNPSLHLHSCVARLSPRTLLRGLCLFWAAVMQTSEDGGAE